MKWKIFGLLVFVVLLFSCSTEFFSWMNHSKEAPILKEKFYYYETSNVDVIVNLDKYKNAKYFAFNDKIIFVDMTNDIYFYKDKDKIRLHLRDP